MRDLSGVLAQFIGDFSSRKSAKMVKFSTDKHAQPNFVRDSCVYANFGQCDWAFTSMGANMDITHYISAMDPI